MKKMVLLTTLFCIFLLTGLSGFKFYRNIFKLTEDQVALVLRGNFSKCKKISECQLQSGDILIRRYITSRTKIIDMLMHPYFTHSAYYLGDGLIVEAGGQEKNREDDIRVVSFSGSDWLNPDLKNFVIIRPKKYGESLGEITNNLINIANDPDYRFGIYDLNNKRTTCADLIFRQLVEENVVNIDSMPTMVTPDYMFWNLSTHLNNFEIVGYSGENLP